MIDKDNWKENQLLELRQWIQEDACRHFGISTPCFEFWLLLHIEESSSNSEKCKEYVNQIRKHWPNYDKRIPRGKIDINAVRKAIARSKRIARVANPEFENTVRMLAEQLLPKSEKQ